MSAVEVFAAGSENDAMARDGDSLDDDVHIGEASLSNNERIRRQRSAICQMSSSMPELV